VTTSAKKAKKKSKKKPKKEKRHRDGKSTRSGSADGVAAGAEAMTAEATLVTMAAKRRKLNKTKQPENDAAVPSEEP
jgi:hypothetical protein